MELWSLRPGNAARLVHIKEGLDWSIYTQCLSCPCQHTLSHKTLVYLCSFNLCFARYKSTEIQNPPVQRDEADLCQRSQSKRQQ